MTEHQFESDRDGSRWRLIGPEAINSIDPLSPEIMDPDGQPLAGVRVKLPPELGSGRIEMVKVRESAYITCINAEFAKPYLMTGDPRMAKVRILLSGGLQVNGAELSLTGAGAYLEVDPGEQFNSYILKEGCQTRFVVVNYRPEFFSTVANIPAHALPQPLAGLFGDATEPRVQYTSLGPDLLRSASDIMGGASNYSPELRRAFLSVKCQEIACAVIHSLTVAQDNPRPKGLSLRDVHRIYEARDILIASFPKAPSVDDLSRTLGLNRTKLKTAFKAVHGMSIAEFLMKSRMDRAADLITTSDLTIAEIAYSVGYEHPSNFTSKFLDYHGVNPSHVRRSAVLARSETVRSPIGRLVQ